MHHPSLPLLFERFEPVKDISSLEDTLVVVFKNEKHNPKGLSKISTELAVSLVFCIFVLVKKIFLVQVRLEVKVNAMSGAKCAPSRVQFSQLSVPVAWRRGVFESCGPK